MSWPYPDPERAFNHLVPVPEIRGHKPIPDERYTVNDSMVDDSGKRANRPFSPHSYAALYGVGIDDAKDMIEAAGGPMVATHLDIEERILSWMREDERIRQVCLNPVLLDLDEAVEEAIQRGDVEWFEGLVDGEEGKE